MGCVELVLDTVSGVGLISSRAYLLSACFCPSLSFLSARLRRRIADGVVDFNCCANCGLRRAASDPNCVVHCKHGAVVVVRMKLVAPAPAVRAPIGAAARDLSARREAPLRRSMFSSNVSAVGFACNTGNWRETLKSRGYGKRQS